MPDQPMKSPAQARLGQGGIQGTGGGATFQPLQRVEADSGTLDLLLQVGGAIMAPHIEKAQQEAYLQGATRVAQGESLRDIVDEQPWYARIFGPAASAQGARQAASIKQVDAFTNRLFELMPELAQLPMEEAAKRVNTELTEHLTGDPQTDMVIQQKMLESSGQFFRAHAKEHVKFVQQTMQSEVTGSIIEATKVIQNMGRQRAKGMISEDDWQLAQANAAAALMPLEGQTEDSYWSAVMAAATDAMVQGNFHIVSIMQESGLIDQMPVADRKKLLDNVRKYENITRERDGYWEYGAQIAQLRAAAATGQISPAQIGQEIDRLNMEFSATTGIGAPLFSRKEMQGVLEGNYKALYRAAKEARKTQDAELKEARDQAIIAQMVGARMGDEIKALGYEGALVDRAIAEQVVGLMNEREDNSWAQALADHYTHGRGHVNPIIKARMGVALRQAKGSELHPGASMDQAYALWLSMNQIENGIGARAAYFGEDDVRMENYHQQMQMEADPNVAYQLAFGSQKRPVPAPDNKEVVEGVNGAINTLTGRGWFSRLFSGGWQQDEGATEALSYRVGAKARDYIGNTTLPQDKVYEIATQQVLNSTDVVGPWNYELAEGQARMHEVVQEDKSRVDKEVVSIVEERMKDLGYNVFVPGRAFGRLRDGRSKVLAPAEARSRFSGAPAGIAEGAAGVGWDFFSTEKIRHVNIIPTRTQFTEDGDPYQVYTFEVHTDSGREKFLIDTREIKGRILKDKSYEPHIK